MLKLLNSYNPKGKYWLKGNLHCHTDRSDGACSTQQIIDIYKNLGCDFLMISDHDVLSNYQGLDAGGMVLIPGNEICLRGPHLLHVNASRTFKPEKDRQQVINEINKDGFAICNHPRWKEDYNHIPFSDLMKWKNYSGIEIYNYLCMLQDGSGDAVDVWDRLLSSGRRVWGYANDDAHRDYECGKAWNVVFVEEISLDAIIKALQKGSFYASTGVDFTCFEVDGLTIRVKSSNAQKLMVSSEHNQRCLEVMGNEIEYTIKKSDCSFVRITGFGGPEQYAWTQPFYIEGSPVTVVPENISCLEVPVVDKGPVLSGKLDDPLWQKGALADKFVEYKSLELEYCETRARILCSRQNLYIGVACSEPEPDKLVARHSTVGSAIWTDDSVEIFIDTAGERKGFYHFLINSEGDYEALDYDLPEFHGLLQIKTGKTEKAWILETAIPISSLGENVGIDRTWAFNIGRNRKTQPQESTIWKWTGRSWQTPHKFGEMRFIRD
ncbi:MAG: CehA/McbA family metallohydrolase [bacterium]